MHGKKEQSLVQSFPVEDKCRIPEVCERPTRVYHPKWSCMTCTTSPNMRGKPVGTSRACHSGRVSWVCCSPSCAQGYACRHGDARGEKQRVGEEMNPPEKTGGALPKRQAGCPSTEGSNNSRHSPHGFP